MLRPTIYIARRELCLLTARWRAADAHLTRREPNEPTRDPAPRDDRPLVAVGMEED